MSSVGLQAQNFLDLAIFRRRLAAFYKFVAQKDDRHFRGYIMQLTEELRPDIEELIVELEELRKVKCYNRDNP